MQEIVRHVTIFFLKWIMSVDKFIIWFDNLAEAQTNDPFCSFLAREQNRQRRMY